MPDSRKGGPLGVGRHRESWARMHINMFQGGRRVAALLAALATIVVLLIAATSHPYLSINYQQSGVDQPPVRTDESCPTEASSDYFSASTPEHHTVYITLCLLTMPSGKNEQQLVPYKTDASGTVWGAPAYSSQVSSYASNTQSRFVLSAADGSWADSQISRRYWSNWFHSIGYLAVGLLIFWAIVWAIGWVVRGFAGVPPGQDHRTGSRGSGADS